MIVVIHIQFTLSMLLGPFFLLNCKNTSLIVIISSKVSHMHIGTVRVCTVTCNRQLAYGDKVRTGFGILDMLWSWH